MTPELSENEYLKQLKRLIKKYHPDLCNDDYVKSVYAEITVKLVNKLNEIKLNEARQTENSGYNNFGTDINGKCPAGVKEQDYLFYKMGMKYYKNIHPNYFYKRNSDTTFVTKTYDELLSVLNNIYLSFNLSEYYFNKVIEEYPDSPYSEDCKSKIKLLKNLHKSYDNLIVEENKVVNNNDFMNEMGLKIL